MFSVVSDYYSSKLKGKQYKQKPHQLLKSYKSEIKIIANPGLLNRALNNPAQYFSTVGQC